MALITSQSEVQTLTLAEKQSRVKALMAQQLTQAFQVLQNTLNQLAQTVWANPEGLTTQQVLDAVGTDSAALFQVSGMVAQLLSIASGLEPQAVMPAGWTYEIHPDGRVTVTQG